MRSLALAVAAAFIVTLAASSTVLAGGVQEVSVNVPDSLVDPGSLPPQDELPPRMARTKAPGAGLWGIDSRNPARLYRLNTATGAATPWVTTNGAASFAGLTWLGDTLYGTDLIYYPGYHPYWDCGTIDDTTGAMTFVSEQGGSYNWHGFATNDSECVMYAIDINFGLWLRKQYADGSIVTVGGGTGIDGRGMAYDDANGILYATGGSGYNNLYRVDTTTGTSTFIGAMGSGTAYYLGLAYDEVADILYLNAGFSPSYLYRVNVTTGAATLIGNNGYGYVDGLAWYDGSSTACAPPIGGAEGCGLEEIEAKLDDEFRFTDDDELRELRDELNGQLAALEAKADDMGTFYCDIVRLLHTPSGIRTADCEGQHYV